MSNQNIQSDLLVELSAEEQQLLSGGQQRSRRPIICYSYGPYEDDFDRGGRGGRGGRGRDVDVDVDVDVERGRRRRF
ncbi:hypothetical protein [Anabaena lutea]|uniref:Uncharacterized protein n=1 Tax=Anabaena lutea FACHB-196 TaxID=2692881 RepID=A0ABR8FDD5_9NOST|nr:hypothetical protein [Anabaena lutea]MBD2567202.1 hypothetical protein [Anabaena lutea FACHB-196]